MDGRKKAEQLESLDNLLTERKLQASFGTCKTDFSVISSEILMCHLPAMDEKLPSAILINSITWNIRVI